MSSPRLFSPGIAVGHTKKRGRGVFATSAFVPGQLIETCPVIVLKDDEIGTALESYVFWWPGRPPGAALALGFGSLYNHSEDPNARTRIVKSLKQIHILAKKPIKSGEEILFNYDYPDGHYNFKVK